MTQAAIDFRTGSHLQQGVVNIAVNPALGSELKEFAGEVPWVHLDIAGMAYRDEALPYLRKGATGVPTRLFIEWVRTRAQA